MATTERPSLASRDPGARPDGDKGVSIAEEIAEESYRQRGYRPLTLSDRQRRLMESRGVQRIQPRPSGVAPIPLGVGGSEGIPYDVLFALEALRQQAEQGNRFARFMYEYEREKLGIDRPRVVIPAK